MERTNVITVKGNGVTLIGPELKAGDKAPDFTVVDKGLQERKLSDFAGKVKLLSVTPSLDTPVCDAQARRFNEEAAKLGGNVALINISMDLPFAIGRFCTAAGIDKVETLSDHRDASFGKAYGVLIKELRLHARAIFVVDAEDKVTYVEIVPEMVDNPNFDAALAAAQAAAPKVAAAA
ncbi:MAG: thiol peroxidase [Proteobacteria bacterium]|nr:thiol peroxidase [Pseudomonadota bacterium]